MITYGAAGRLQSACTHLFRSPPRCRSTRKRTEKRQDKRNETAKSKIYLYGSRKAAAADTVDKRQLQQHTATETGRKHISALRKRVLFGLILDSIVSPPKGGTWAEPGSSATLGQPAAPEEQAPSRRQMAKIRLISWVQIGPVSDIKLIRTDTTL